MIDERRVATLRLDEFLEFLERRTIGQMPLHRLLGRQRRTRDAGETNDLHAELQHEFLHVLRTFALEELNRFLHFERRSDGVTERLIHVGHQRNAATLHRAPHARHRTRQLLRLLEILDEGAVAPLHVDHESFRSFRELLRKHASGDERQTWDRAGLFAQFVELGVGRREILGLRDDRAADARELRREMLVRLMALETRESPRASPSVLMM